MALIQNIVILSGNMTRDVELREVGSSTVGNFGLAMSRKYKGSDGEMKEETCFVDVECWNAQAVNAAKYTNKGQNITIEGSLKMDQWEDKDTGQQRSKLKVNAHRIHFFLGNKSADTSAPDPRDRTKPVAASVDDGDMPF